MTGEILVEMCKSIFITIRKKLGVNECELLKTISLMSNITILKNRNISTKAKMNIAEIYTFWSILLYGCNCWTLFKVMWVYRRLIDVSLT